MNNGFYITEETAEAQREASAKAEAKRTKRADRQTKVLNYIKAHPNFIGTPTQLAKKVDSRHTRQVATAISNMVGRGKLYRSSDGRVPSRWSTEPFGETAGALSPESTQEPITGVPAPAAEPKPAEKQHIKFTLTGTGFKLETNERVVEVEL